MESTFDKPPVLERVAKLACNISFNKLCSGVTYGAAACIYQPITVAAMELSSPQCLLLALLNSLVTGDATSCILLANVCLQVKQLRSKYLKVWLMEDFVFPREDMEKAMSVLAELETTGLMKLPSHVMEIMSSVAWKYGITGFQIRLSSEEDCGNLAVEMENAVSNNSPGDIINLVTAGGDVNGLTESGDSLLHLAARTGNSASIAALCFLQADLEILNSNIASPLEVAVRNNNEQSVRALLKAGAKIDKQLLRGDTYLHIAAAGGHNSAMLALLEGGLNINVKNHLDETPLFQAVKAGNVCGVEALLQRGADINIRPEGSKSLVEIVVESKNVAMFKVCIKWSALSGFQSQEGDSIFHLVAISGNTGMFKILKDLRLSANIKNKNGVTPLHVASDISIMTMLLGMGLFVDEIDNAGFTPLMTAIKSSKPEIVAFLLHNGANPNIKNNLDTPLHLAAASGYAEIVTILLEAGARMEEKDDKGMTPAFVAAVKNKPNVLKLFRKRGADLILKDYSGEGMIHYAARSGYPEIILVLLDAGVMVDMKGIGQHTALHYAVEKGHVSVVSVLLSFGADVNAMTNIKKCSVPTSISRTSHPFSFPKYESSFNFNGSGSISVVSEPDIVDSWTPLIAASKIGSLDVVKLLLNNGANVNDKDTPNNWTALQWAQNNKHTSVADYLRLAGVITSNGIVSA